MEPNGKGTGGMAQVGAAQGSRATSDGGHGPESQARLSAGFLGYRGVSIEPLGDLRGAGGGPAAALSAVDSTLAAAPVPVLGQRGALGGLPGGPRAAVVLKAVGDFLRGRKAGPRQARRGKKQGRHSTGIALKKASAFPHMPA